MNSSHGNENLMNVRNDFSTLRKGKKGLVHQARLKDFTSRSWSMDLEYFFKMYGDLRIKDPNAKVSHKTTHGRWIQIYCTVNYLIDNGYAKNLSHVHPRLLPRIFEYWNSKRVGKRAQINYYTYFCWFWHYANIPTKDIAAFASFTGEFTINRAAVVDKSWIGNDVDFEEIYNLFFQQDPILAYMLLAIKTFGLRPQEAVCLRPHLSDKGDSLYISEGTKNGRPRTLLFKDMNAAECRQVLDFLKQKVIPGDYLGWKGKALHQSMAKLYYLLRKLGVCKSGKYGVILYGLRHEFAHELFQSQTGELPPIKGGLGINYKLIKNGVLTTSRSLGHSRTEITGAYCGSASSNNNDQKRHIFAAFNRLRPVLEEKIRDLLEENDINNLHWIGDLTLNHNARSSLYELMLPEDVSFDTALLVIPLIEQMVIDSTGYQCIVQHFSLMAETKKLIWANESIPLFDRVTPPEDCLKDMLLSQRKAGHKSVLRMFNKSDDSKNT